LILAGRSPLPYRESWNGVHPAELDDPRIAAVRDLETQGVNIRTEVADMGNEASVRSLITQCLLPDHPPLRGVFHAAGVMQYDPLSDQTPDQMRDILGAKMVGGWLLHRLLADVPLDLFVLFSSFSALLSSPLMGSYSAANVFLDSLAHHRRAMRRPALSVNWGTWADVGMATRFQEIEQSRRHGRTGPTKGAGTLSSQQALEALERLLEEDAVQVGVMPMDWAAWEQSYGGLARTPYFSLLTSGDETALPENGANEASRDSFLAAETEERGESLSSYLAKEIARILKVPLALVDREKPISNLGLDSLMSIELKRQLEFDLGVNIEMSRLLQGPTPLELRDWVLDSLTSVQTAETAFLVKPSTDEFEEGAL